MGTDKGLLVRQERTWAQLAYAQLCAFQFPVYLSIQPEQKAAYTAFFHPDQLLPDQTPFRGPLAALMTAHQTMPAVDWLILACDLPDMQPEVLRKLLEMHDQRADYEAFVCEKDGQWEPLCGIYTARGLQQIARLWEQQQLTRHSMKYILEQIHTYTLPLPEAWKGAFRNYNAPADLT